MTPKPLASEYHVRFLPESPRDGGWIYVTVGTPGDEHSLGHHHGGPAALRAAARHLLAIANKIDEDRGDRGEATDEAAPPRHWHGATHHVPGAGFAIMPRPT